MDYCCEREVSGDRQLRLLRIAATAQLFGACSRAAEERGIARPMPVIQGWHAHEYAQCIEWLPIGNDAWPDLVGVGSVCRRQLEGEHGILNIVATLDRLLPAKTKLHLFGVKSATLAALGPHPRIASMDSMAWDFGARVKRRTGRDMKFRIACMAAWAEQQRALAQQIVEGAGEPGGPGGQMELGLLGGLYDRQALNLTGHSDEAVALEALTLVWCDLLLEHREPAESAVIGRDRQAA